jgi:hypothetical protein
MNSLLLCFLSVTLSLGISSQSSQTQNSHAVAQQEARTLSNADVVGMVKGGLSEGTILLVIGHSSCNFDTSPAALVALRNQGVSQEVMEAMIRAQDSAAAAPHQETTSIAADANKVAGPELLAEGVYYKGPTGWVRLELLSMAGGGATHVAKMLVPGLTPQVVWTFRGAEAPVQISDSKPSFYIKQSPYLVNVPGHSGRDIVMVRFDKKKDHRELQTTSGGNMLTFKSGLSKEKAPEITVTRLSDTLFRIEPNYDLQPAEYFLTFGATAASGYDFGIIGKK